MSEHDIGPSLASGPRPYKVVYAIIENKNGKSFWNRIGAAFTNRDGSITIKLDCVPLGGTMQVRDPEPREFDRESRGSSFGASSSLAQAGF